MNLAILGFGKSKKDNNNSGIASNKLVHFNHNDPIVNKEEFINCYSHTFISTILKSISSEILQNIKIDGYNYDNYTIINGFVTAFFGVEGKQYINKNGNTIIAIVDSNSKIKEVKYEEIKYNLQNKNLLNSLMLIANSYAGLLVLNHNQIVLSDVLQLKIKDLRQNQANTSDDVGELDNTIKSIVDPLYKDKAKTILLDAEDEILFLKNDNNQTLKEAREVLNNNLSALLNLPLSYFTGEFKSSLGSSNSSDVDFRDKGLINFYNSYLSPYLKQLGFLKIKSTYGIESLFKKQSTKDFLLFLESTSLIEDLKKQEILKQFLESQNINTKIG
jgi:hypothetical protein